jgi:hypothetical protein
MFNDIEKTLCLAVNPQVGAPNFCLRLVFVVIQNIGANSLRELRKMIERVAEKHLMRFSEDLIRYITGPF